MVETNTLSGDPTVVVDFERQTPQSRNVKYLTMEIVGWTLSIVKYIIIFSVFSNVFTANLFAL